MKEGILEETKMSNNINKRFSTIWDSIKKRRYRYKMDLGSLKIYHNMKRDSRKIEGIASNSLNQELAFFASNGYNLRQDVTGYFCSVPEYKVGGCANYNEKSVFFINTHSLKKNKSWKEFLRMAISHELAHVLMSQNFHIRNIPVWLNEGIASFSSDRNGAWIYFEKIRDNWLSPREWFFLYNFGRSLVITEISFLAFNFLVKKFGVKKIFQLIEILSSGYSRTKDNIQVSFEKIYNFGPTALNKMLKESILFSTNRTIYLNTEKVNFNVVIWEYGKEGTTAIGLNYYKSMDSPPKLIAKGKKGLAISLKRIAITRNIPVIRNKISLSLYKLFLNDSIPRENYREVANIYARILSR